MREYILQRPKIKSKILRELNAAATIAARDITLFFKSPGTIIMSLAMPLVMMGKLGGSLQQNMAGGLGFDYGEFMLVGMLVNMLCNRAGEKQQNCEYGRYACGDCINYGGMPCDRNHFLCQNGKKPLVRCFRLMEARP